MSGVGERSLASTEKVEDRSPAKVRVLDLTDESGVFCTRLLADLGFEVVRVESPSGDRVRTMKPFLGAIDGLERSLWHLYHNAGKKSVTLDRASVDGEEALWSLVAGADVVVETEGLAHSRVQEVNPSVIHVTVSPFGLGGPLAHWKGGDLIAAAAGGLAHVCGGLDEPPNHPGADQSYKMAGLAAAAGVMIALTGRDRRQGSPGVHLDISIQEAVAMSLLQTSNPAQWAWNKQVPQRPGISAVHQCADGNWITLSVRPHRRDALAIWADSVGIQVSDEAWTALADPSGGAAVVAELVSTATARFDRDELMTLVEDLDLMGLPVNSLPDLESCEQLHAMEEFVEVRHEPLKATLRFPRSPVGELVSGGIQRAPTLGEHTAETLGALPKKATPAVVTASGLAVSD
jgi:crotonobetainyl-CoA:carnitine CoA-transferase CaiB-like acyl-CoA transferase